ncbi:Bicarbonate transport ATP-binding protein CmpD [Pigmentiphaga humi]|uniref:Bicarbonate transport ATP-binding protein CmpD n=1 Tax=Pigmentiphaga humi TaxID=2478468 RepID=A0A3P4B0D8_9BURK|nr:ABC transporter ATP-binding protein [Pigmentiphaga humi]VCU69118.1 Bicarbonate transport ATP-binding protein CmpD [Pigmentiphaga humi]
MAAVIEFKGLAYRHPGAAAPVIQGLDLDIQAGEFLAVVGGSGVGKSTLLRTAAGLIEPASGEVDLRLPVRAGRRRRAVVFQDGRLLPWRTVAGNVAYGLETLGIDKRELRARVAEALQLTGLSELAGRWPHQLSGGQVQRVGIARALAVKPDILLMDEPFSAVDALTRRHLQAELLRIWQATRAAIMFVTHDIEEAVFLADRVIVLGGRPANIVENLSIGLPRPRDRGDAEFGHLVSHLSDQLGFA